MTPGVWFAIAVAFVVSGLVTIAWSFRKAARRRGLKRAWLRVAIGLGLIGLGLAARLGPIVQSRGVAGLTPTGVLLSQLRDEDRPAAGGWEDGRPLVRELTRRVEAGTLTPGQRERLASWQLEGVRVADVVSTRRHWPMGETPTFTVDLAPFFGLEDRELRLRTSASTIAAAMVEVSEWRRNAAIPPRTDRVAGYWSDWYVTPLEAPTLGSFDPAEGRATLTLELIEGGDVVWSASGDVPFGRVEEMDDALTAVDGASDAARVREGLGLSMSVAGPRRWYISMDPRPDLCSPALGVSLTIELLWRGNVAATLGGLVVCSDGNVAFGSHAALLEPDIGPDDPRDAGWALRVRGTTDGLLSDIGVEQWWAGQFTVPAATLIAMETSRDDDGSATPARPE